MKIKLSQAITLMSVIKKRIQELKREREEVSYLLVEKGEQYELPVDRTFNQVVSELEAAQKDLLELETAIAQANVTSTIQWDEKQITIGEAIQLAKLYREQAREHATYGSKRNNTPYGTNMYQVLTYDPKKYAELSQKLNRKANKLSELIDEVNILTYIDFPRYHIYMD